MINGVAAGAGLALALACDMRFAARGVTLTTSYVRVAMSGDLGVSYFLTQLVGSAKARELMFIGDKISAEEALRIGLVTRVEDAPGLRQMRCRVTQHRCPDAVPPNTAQAAAPGSTDTRDHVN